MKIKVKEIAQVLVALPQNVKKGERGRAQWLKPGNIFEDMIMHSTNKKSLLLPF